ncbi:SagB/ThcOx family dehydrogenase [Streptomyces sp. 891-h]|nr:SagB/ThcOx family dehydrogenase [Streptomyces sp. 891-h]
MSIDQITRVVWAAQGRTTGEHRSCPSAHALYPLTLTVISGNVDGLAAGAYQYDAERHALIPAARGDHRDRVAGTTLADHCWLRHAAALLLLSGDMDAATRHFADQPPHSRRGRRYVWLEAGHASQNVYLQAAEAGLGAVLVAGFDDDRLLGLSPAVVPAGRQPLALLGVGHPADAEG